MHHASSGRRASVKARRSAWSDSTRAGSSRGVGRGVVTIQRRSSASVRRDLARRFGVVRFARRHLHRLLLYSATASGGLAIELALVLVEPRECDTRRGLAPTFGIFASTLR